MKFSKDLLELRDREAKLVRMKRYDEAERIKMKAALEADPERKQIEMAKKAERRRGRRVAKLADKKNLSPNEKLLNFEQSLITRQLNDKIKANPNIIFNNKKLIDQLSTTVDSACAHARACVPRCRH